MLLSEMNIALFGTGKMGKLVEQLAPSYGHIISHLQIAEVCIDFSHHSLVLDHLQSAIEHQTPIIIGTTGWEAGLEQARNLVENSSIGALYAPNFSIGMAYFIKLLKQARLLFSDYDCAGVEIHHNQKIDSPSGTAKTIANTLEMKTPFTSVRCGRITGKHEVLFDSPFDSITLTHESHNREGFARGSLKAAEWILDKKGWFTLDDMLRCLYRADHAVC